MNFTITAEIHARSLVNFYGQYADRHMNLKFMRRVSERASVGNSTVCYRKKQMNDLPVAGYPCYAQRTLGSPGANIASR